MTSDVRINITVRWNQFCSEKSNKNYIFWMCVCSLSYPSCNVHTPYHVVIRGLSGCTIFFHRRHDFRKARFWTL